MSIQDRDYYKEGYSGKYDPDRDKKNPPKEPKPRIQIIRGWKANRKIWRGKDVTLEDPARDGKILIDKGSYGFEYITVEEYKKRQQRNKATSKERISKVWIILLILIVIELWLLLNQEFQNFQEFRDFLGL